MKTTGKPWGLRSQLGATVKLLDDLKTGNNDGIVSNEDKPAGTVGNAFERNPLARRTKDALSVGLSSSDEISRLSAFVVEMEAEWGQPVLNSDVKAKMNGGDLYAAQKAIRLARMGRDPSDVTNHFVKASGSVMGREIATRDVHVEKWAPVGTPTGKTIVVSPGYLETGRTFDEQIQKLTEKGHAVVVMDHQWAGQSDGKPGGIDSGFGVARDVAAVTAFAAQQAKADFGNDGAVVIFGNSMGGGPGALGAALLNDQGAIDLDGAQMPKGVDLVLQAPFFGATKSATNLLLQGGAQIPMLNRMQLPGTGLPDITDDPRAEQLGAQGMVLEDVRAQLSAFMSAQGDVDALFARMAGGQKPSGRISIVGNDKDTLADPKRWDELKSLLGDHVKLQTFAGDDHVMSQALGQQDRAIDALDAMLEHKGVVANPRKKITIPKIHVKLDESRRSGQVDLRIPLKDLNTAPMGDRAFIDDIVSARVPMPFAKAPGEFDVSVAFGDNPSLQLSMDNFRPEAALHIDVPIEIVTKSGQLVLLELDARSLELDERVPQSKQMKISLVDAQKDVEALTERIEDLRTELRFPPGRPESIERGNVETPKRMRAQSADKKARRALNEAYFARKDFLDEHIQNADPILLAHSILVAGDGEALKSITPKLVAAKEKVSQLEELVHAMAPHVRHPGVAASLEGHNADLVEARKNANTLQADFDHAVHVARGEIKDEHFYAIYEAVNELDGPTLKDIDTQRDDVDRKLKAHESYFKTERLQIPDKIEDTKVELRKAKRRVSELEAQLSSTTPILRSISID